MAISDEVLLEYSRQAFIPGPEEEEEEFLKRINFCLNIKNTLSEQTGEPLELCSDLFLKTVSPITQKIYDISPLWIPIVFDNHKLFFWHGGSAWIFQLEEDSPLSAFIQMRKEFKIKDTWLNIFHRKEILVHEIAHIGRMAFDEPKYEEILAYSSSSSKKIAYLGGLIKNSKESALFVLILFLIIFLDLFFLISGEFEFYAMTAWFKLIPCFMVLYSFIRLFFLQKNFKNCLVQLKKTFKQNEHAIIYRLTDDEIDLFAKSSPNDIKNYALNQKTLRWRLINLYINS